MMKKYYWLLLLPFVIKAQTGEYRSAENKYYWKNRKPYEGYWQQDVDYTIKAKLDEANDVVEGDETLVYYNNSPDTLPFVFFHLYSNAQNKNSYLSDLYKNNKLPLHYGKYREQNLGMETSNISAAGENLKSETDNTIMKVWLKTPLKPGESVTLNIHFKTYFDKEAIRNRMKEFAVNGYKHFDLVHWYPRISVYDKKQGWDTDQHMDHEFYGDFGTFNIELSLPNNYICDGTGVLVNEKEVLPTELRQQLDISNFAKKPWNSAPTEIIKPDGSYKTWKFRAINVHDAGYTFDPTYRIGEALTNNNVRCIALVSEPHAAGWQTAALYAKKIIETNSKNIGEYAYPKMIVADAQDGMEYPMMTLDGGFDPNYLGLFTHEISHNWFFGMLGSNETYRAFMDEGFTQFYTCDTWENMVGKYELTPKIKNAYVRNHTDTVLTREANGYLSYFSAALKGSDVTLNTHSDDFNGAIRHGGGYGQVYTKTVVMLYNLRYVLGDSLFKSCMQHYFNQWKMCHPYPEDMRNAFVQASKADLNWFFDEWLETAKTVDYGVKKVKRIKGTTNYKITFKRYGRMQMPLDFTVKTESGKTYNYYIPNTWFEKKTTATVLPRWIGWGKVKPVYTATINIPSDRITNVVIDTAHIFPDVNPYNNSRPRAITFKLDSRIANLPDRNHYTMFAGPALWYNGYDGVKAGFNVNGNYMNYKHIFDFTAYINTALGQAKGYLPERASVNSYFPASFLLNYRTATDKFMKKSGVYATLKAMDGLASALVGFDRKSIDDKNRIYIQFKGFTRFDSSSMNYLIYRGEWSSVRRITAYASVGIDRNTTYNKGTWFANLNLRMPTFSPYDFTAATLTIINKHNLARKIGLNTRLFAQYGYGNSVPVESMLYAAGANPEELMDNKFTRSMGIFAPFSFGNNTTNANFAAGGGLNLRGYMGYLLPQADANGNYRYNYRGTSGVSINAELDFSKCFSFVQKITNQTISFGAYLFGDAGVINTNYNYEPVALSNIIADAGVGTTVTIQKWWKFQTLKPLTVRVDFPLLINRLPYVESNYFGFRCVVGISRAF